MSPHILDNLFIYFIIIFSSNYLIIIGLCDEFSQEEVQIKFRASKIDPNFLYSLNRIEHAERNTSKDYKIWQEMELNLIEWPGNITRLDPDFPLLSWGKKKAKLLNCPCSIPLGMDFKAYAYKYLHLSWGPFRMMSSYCPPLRIPISIFTQLSILKIKESSLELTDFEFGPTSLLIIIQNKIVVSVENLEGAHKEKGKRADFSLLHFTIAQGIDEEVSKIVTMKCCKHKITKTCPHGHTVLLYAQKSTSFNIFISNDGGKYFRKLHLQNKNSIYLYGALIYPSIRTIVGVVGHSKSFSIAHFSMSSGHPLNFTHQNNYIGVSKKINFDGFIQIERLGEEFSLLLNTDCKIYYSPDAGLNLQSSVFYIHNSLTNYRNVQKTKNHQILTSHCYFGQNSRLTFDKSGKIGILDSENNFFYSIDSKSSIGEDGGLNFHQFLGTFIDMSLIMSGKENSIAPYFDFNHRPKLMYPPRYLYSDDMAYKNENYSKRANIKLFPRSIFPSDFILPFTSQNIPQKYQKYSIKNCQSSGLSIDGSISQKSQIFHIHSKLNFSISFKSQINNSELLQVEPLFYLKFLKITIKLREKTQLGLSSQIFYKYEVEIVWRPIALPHSIFRLNFFTLKSISCIIQPQVSIFIQIEENEAEAEMKMSEEYEKNFISDPESIRISHNYLNGTILKAESSPTVLNTCSKSFTP